MGFLEFVPLSRWGGEGTWSNAGRWAVSGDSRQGVFWPPRFSQPSGIEESIRGPRELARRNMFESRTPLPPKGLARQGGTSAREFEVSLSWFAFHGSAEEK